MSGPMLQAFVLIAREDLNDSTITSESTCKKYFTFVELNAKKI